MGRRHDRFAGSIALGDDIFLNDGNRLNRNLDAEISARDHDSVGGRNDRIELGERLVFFDLSNDRYAFVPFGDKRLRSLHVFSRTHEGERYVINASFETELQKLKIALGDRWDIQRTVGIVDAYGSAQIAAEFDRRIDLRRALSDDQQRDLSVLKIKALADSDVCRPGRDRSC